MDLGLLDQLQIFSQLYLVELLGLLKGLGLLELWHLIYPRLLTGFDMLVFFTNLSLMEFQFRYLALFLRFSVIYGFEWFWMEVSKVSKNIFPDNETICKLQMIAIKPKYKTIVLQEICNKENTRKQNIKH